MALERLKNSASVSALAQVGVHRTVLYYCQRQPDPQGTDATATSPVRELREAGAGSEAGGGKDPRSGFCQRCVAKKSNLDARAAEALAGRHLGPDPGSDANARQPEHRAHVCIGRGSAVLVPSVAAASQRFVHQL